MPKNGKTSTSKTRESVSTAKKGNRLARKTYAITQRGIFTSADLTAFHSAALADIDSGRADLKEMTLMRAITGQIIAHENLKLKAGAYKTSRKGSFLNA